MNINRNLIRKQADFVMLNSCSVSSSGLYNGKAGMSWALFETARLLDDEYMEEQALQTLQEALLTQTKNVGFEKGLSGIGYVLLCLIRDGLVDADFDELFADKLALVHGYAGKLCTDAAEGSLQIGGMKNILFLDMHHRCTGNAQSLELRNRLLKAYGKMFKEPLCDFNREKVQVSKVDFLMYVEDYLKIVDECDPEELPTDMIDNYIEGYMKGKWMSRFSLAAALYGIARKVGNPEWEAVAMQQADIALHTVDVHRETLRSMTDILSYELPLESYRKKRTEVRSFLFPTDEQTWLQHLSCAIAHKGMVAGYASGMARLLLCTVNECIGQERIKMW